MTLTQLDYIVAVDTFRHFATAADACHITQPTLSMQIQKLEDELGVLIFDRSKQPVVPTETGVALLTQAREVLRTARRIPEIVSESKNELRGDLRIGIIPTLAPYLLPYFIGEFIGNYPDVSVRIEEFMTEQIVERLRTGLIDVGMVVTPLGETGIAELPLFREPFVVYAAENHTLLQHETVTAADLQTDGLWLLTEGHCFRDQVANLCGADRNKGRQKQPAANEFADGASPNGASPIRNRLARDAHQTHRPAGRLYPVALPGYLRHARLPPGASPPVRCAPARPRSQPGYAPQFPETPAHQRVATGNHGAPTRRTH